MDEKIYMKNLTRMSNDDLPERYIFNKKHIVGNNAFLGAVTVGSLFVCHQLS